MRSRHGNTMHKHFARILAALAVVAGAAHATPVPGQGTWETTLLARDINRRAVSINDPSAEFAYDKVLDATWYLSANNTGLGWESATSWAAGLTVGTFGGWSLPATDTACFDFNCTGSQLGELYYTALGNPAGTLPSTVPSLSNTGPFKNLRTYVYWSATEYARNPAAAWILNTFYGSQYTFDKGADFFALAIRPGDILVAVPEPETYAMLLAGLGLVGAMVRRHHRSVSGTR